MQCKSLSGQLYDGYDEEYDCPILDEDRVSMNFKVNTHLKSFNWKVDIHFFKQHSPFFLHLSYR